MSHATILPEGGATAYRITSGHLHLPGSGLWQARIEVDHDEALAGTLSLRMGETLTLTGTIVDGSVFNGSGSYLVVGGRGGWRKPIPEKSYQGPLARLATIATDAARAVGETVSVRTDRVVGPYLRLEGPASDVLRLAASFYVEPDGTTVLGVPPSGLVSPRVLDFRPRVRVVSISEEEVDDITPGKSIVVDGLGEVVIRAVTHDFKGGSQLHV